MALCLHHAITVHLLLASVLSSEYNDNCSDYTPMDTEKKLVKTTVRIPEHLMKELKEAGKKHYRNFNSELIVALEQYLSDWKNKH